MTAFQLQTRKQLIITDRMFSPDVSITINGKVHTSMAIAHSRRMHGIMASGEPVIVTALSVEPGNISLAT